VRLTQATLFTILEFFLRLAHPLMPFLTEELWQRIPRRHLINPSPSIVVARYPTQIPEWSNPTAEKSMKLVTDAIHDARSLRADYKVPNHIKANFYFRTSDKSTREALEKQSGDFCTLAKGNFLKYSEGDDLPKGCCVKVVSDSLSLVVDLTGIVDSDTEIARLTKEVERLGPMIDTYKRKFAASDYETKVPENVRMLNIEKVAGYEAELETTIKALAVFQTMKG
jgi:valyl-tRNA synthetase